MLGEDLPVSRAGKLRASIGVEDKSSPGATLAERHAQGRIVSCLEGGYNLDALARSVEAHLRVLADL